MLQEFYMLYVYIAFGIWAVLISIIAAVVTAHDKAAAQRNAWRVKESLLILVALLGGAAAMYIAMRVIRHKTKKQKFMLGLPLIFILQILLIAGIILTVWRITGDFNFLIL